MRRADAPVPGTELRFMLYCAAIRRTAGVASAFPLLLPPPLEEDAAEAAAGGEGMNDTPIYIIEHPTYCELGEGGVVQGVYRDRLKSGL